MAARSARDHKNSPSRLRFRPPNRPTFGFRLRPPGWASTYSRSVLGANGTVEVSRRPFKSCRNAELAICKVFSFQHFPHPGGLFCGQPLGISWTGAKCASTKCERRPSPARTRTGSRTEREVARGGRVDNSFVELDITRVTVRRIWRSKALLPEELSCFISWSPW